MSALRIILPLVLAALLAGCDRRPAYRRAAGAVWHTVYHITYAGDRDLDDSIIAVMRRVEQSLSPFDSTSLVSAVNCGDTAARADRLLRRVTDGSLRVWQASGGAFDPTVAPLVNLWGFGWTGDGGGRAPTQEQIDSVLTTVGMGECGIDSAGRVRRKHPATQFNFSAITKGLGCDEVGAMLARNGVTDYMVEIGGEIALRGVNERGEPWHVMIDVPRECESGVAHERLTVVELTEGGIATSGNYRNYRDTSGGRVGHTISPVTGRPFRSPTLSATVIAADCMTADALATACMAMEPDSAAAMIRRIGGGTRAILVTAGPDSAMTVVTIP